MQPSDQERSGQKIYQAFISYSHSRDGRLAESLQRGLHRFAKPWYRRRAMWVFRDQTSLSADPSLWSSIERALDSSEYFILMASPESARSTWVDREVEHWLRHHPRNRLLVVVTDGELPWEAGPADHAVPILPPAARELLTHPPKYVDLRWARDEQQLSLRHPEYRSCLADLVATLRGQPKEDLIGEDLTQHRRTVRVAAGAIVALTVLAVVAASSAIVATVQRDEARRQARLATSRYLAVQSAANATDRLDQSLLLAVEAERVQRTPEARSALLTALVRSAGLDAFLHNDGLVQDLALDRAGTLLAVAGEDDAVALWDLRTRRRRAVLHGHDQWVGNVAFVGDGQRLVSVDIDGELILWDATDGRLLRRAAGAVDHLAVSADGRLLVTGRDYDVTVWDALTLTELASMPADDRVSEVAFRPGGRSFVAGLSNGEIVMYESTPGRRNEWAPRRLARQSGSPFGLAFSPDGATLASTDGSAIRLWDVPRGTPSGDQLSPALHNVLALAFTADGGKLLAGGIDNELLVYDLKDRHGPRVTATGYHSSGSTGQIDRVIVTGDGATAITSGSDDERVAVWDLRSVQALSTSLPGHGRRFVAFSPDGARLAAPNADGTIDVWELATPSASPHTVQVGDETIGAVAFSPTAQMLAAVQRNEVILWDLAAGRQSGRALTGHVDEPQAELGLPRAVDSIAFSPDGALLAMAANGNVTIWRLADRAELVLPRDPAMDQFGAHHVLFGPDGRTLFIGGNTGAVSGGVARWDVQARRYRGSVMPLRKGSPNAMAISTDGATMVIATGAIGVQGAVEFLRVSDGAPTGPPITGFSGTLRSVAFSPDGGMVAVGSDPFTVTLWDVRTRQRIGLPLTQADPPTSLAFSPDGGRLAAANAVGVWLWDVDPARWAERACAIANRSLSREEWAQFRGPDEPYEATC